MKKAIFSILLCLPLFVFGQDMAATDYRIIPNDISAWTVGSGAYANNVADRSIICNTAGIAYIPSTQAYGEWTFDLYQGNGANLNRVKFISANATLSPQTTMSLTFTNTESISFARFVSDVPTALWGTAASSLQTSRWYSFKVTRTAGGVFTTYIKSSEYGSAWRLVTATTGTNPVTDNTITTSAYFVIDLDAGDRIRNVKFKPLTPETLTIFKE